ADQGDLRAGRDPGGGGTGDRADRVEGDVAVLGPGGEVSRLAFGVGDVDRLPGEEHRGEQQGLDIGDARTQAGAARNGDRRLVGRVEGVVERLVRDDLRDRTGRADGAYHRGHAHGRGA